MVHLPCVSIEQECFDFRSLVICFIRAEEKFIFIGFGAVIYNVFSKRAQTRALAARLALISSFGAPITQTGVEGGRNNDAGAGSSIRRFVDSSIRVIVDSTVAFHSVRPSRNVNHLFDFGRRFHSSL
jgi:hypothetical protein